MRSRDGHWPVAVCIRDQISMRKSLISDHTLLCTQEKNETEVELNDLASIVCSTINLPQPSEKNSLEVKIYYRNPIATNEVLNISLIRFQCTKLESYKMTL